MLSTALRLVEPTHWTTPDGPRVRPAKVRTYGPIVADLNAAADFAPDPQQELALDLIFAVDEGGLPSSFATWVTACRQNLKTGLMIQASIGWIYLLEVPEILWSAHEAKTAADSMESFSEVVQHPSLSRLLPVQKNRGVYDENGDERVEFNTGQKIGFRTRTKNGARGIARVEKLIVDEGFALTARQTGAMFPVLAAKRGRGQILGGSSAPPIEGDVYREIEDRGRVGAPRTNYLEWLASRESCSVRDCQHPKDALARGIDCALDREHLIVEGNPTISTGRITVQTIRDLRQELPPEEYIRECFGWRDEPDEHRVVIKAGDWNALADPGSRMVNRPTFGLEVAEDHGYAAIATAGKRPDGRVHVEVTSQPIVGTEARLVDYRAGVEWVVERAAELAKRWNARFAVASGSAAMALIPALRAAGVDVDVVKHADVIAACGHFVDQAVQDNLRHLGQSPLNLAVAAARKRKAGDGAWAFGRRASDADITALYAAVIAVWQAHLGVAADYDLYSTIG